MVWPPRRSVVLALVVAGAVAGFMVTPAFASRPATGSEVEQFSAALRQADSWRKCADGTPATAEQLSAIVSDVDVNWARVIRSDEGSACGLGEGRDLMHVVNGVWTYVTSVSGFNYCAAVDPGLPIDVGLDLGYCQATPPGVRLGASGLFPNGEGWGEIRPSTVFNGGVPSGLVWHIRWRNWGGRVASGRGITSIYKPRGGYFRRSARIELRASNIGACQLGGQRTYRRLSARVPRRPGGRLGGWFLWAGQSDLCGAE